jgi:photosystem II stability/assembly factor-like uncharacterized protein
MTARLTHIGLELAVVACSLGILACSDGDGEGGSSGSSSSGSSGSSSSSTGAPPPAPGWRAAVGARGTLVQTFDDESWETRVVASQDLNAVTCIGNMSGWVAGNAGSLLHTPDSGATFYPQSPGTTANLHAVKFGLGLDGSEVGVAAGDEGTLTLSRDGGGSWQKVELQTKNALRAAGIAYAAQVILVVGDGGLVIRSEDSGQSFVERTLEDATDFYGVAMDALGHVVAVDDSGGVWQSDDWGIAFSRTFDAGVPLYAVDSAADGSWTLIAGADGHVLSRDQGGQFRVDVTGNAALRAALISLDGTKGYVAGDAGALFRSDDRGLAWQRADGRTDAALRGLEDLDVY